MTALAEALDLVDAVMADGGRVLALTGAGVSAASGIPTFRGPEGYWTVGSEVYRPEQLATQAMFRRDPDEVWAWYLHRLGVCRAAAPNAAHHALAAAETALGDRLLLITQNVDGLHLRAGSSLARTYQVHGAIELLRCAAACSTALTPMPAGLSSPTAGEGLTEADRALLRCPACQGPARPHVLWFDEHYDEALYRMDSALRAAHEADLLVTVGTSAATTLPNLVVDAAVRAGAALIDVNPEPNPFGALAADLAHGVRLRLPADEVVPALVDRMTGG